MKLSFDEIPEKGLEFDVKDQAWFPDDELKRIGPPAVHVTLRKVDNRVIMDGMITCQVELSCDRCLAEYNAELSSGFSVFFDWIGPPASEIEEEHACTESEMDVIQLEEPVVDIFATLQQQLYLMLPAKSICEENCKGLCYQCGNNLNLGKCTCSGRDIETPFAILTKLKDS